MSNEVELDQHGDAGRQLSALLSAALAAAQSAAQVSAQRARDRARQADEQAQQAQQQTREQQRRLEQAERARQRQLEQQQRAEQAVRHRQWNLKPTAQWLHDNPLSAAAAWASADVHRGEDPVADRHADQWETIFQREGIDVDDIRADAPAAVAAAEHQQAGAGAASGEVAGELAAAEVATGAVIAGAVDIAAAEAAEALAHPAATLDDHKAAMSPAALEVFTESEQAIASGDWDAMYRASRRTADLPSVDEREAVRAAVELRFGPPWDPATPDTDAAGSPGPATTSEPELWSAYADGAPAAQLGGRGVSTPPTQVLAHTRQNPDVSASAVQAAATVALAPGSGVER